MVLYAGWPAIPGQRRVAVRQPREEVIVGFKRIVLLCIVAAAVIFTLQNTQTVEIQLLFWKVSAVRALVLTVTFCMGALSGYLLSRIGLRRQHGRSADGGDRQG